MATVPTERLSAPCSEPAKELVSEVSALLRSRAAIAAAAHVPDDPPGVAVSHVNTALQALMNLFYLLAREARLDPQLQLLVTQIQAVVAQLFRWIQKLGPQGARPIVEKEQ